MLMLVLTRWYLETDKLVIRHYYQTSGKRELKTIYNVVLLGEKKGGRKRCIQSFCQWILNEMSL